MLLVRFVSKYFSVNDEIKTPLLVAYKLKIKRNEGGKMQSVCSCTDTDGGGLECSDGREEQRRWPPPRPQTHLNLERHSSDLGGSTYMWIFSIL